MSAPQPDDCHGGVPTGGLRQDGQGGSVGDAQGGTEGMSDETLESRLRGALADQPPAEHVDEVHRVVAQALASKRVVEAAKVWVRSVRSGDAPELWASWPDLALIAAVVEMDRIEAQR